MPAKINNATWQKDLRKQITCQLEEALGDLRGLLGEKKFNSRVKKAVKELTDGVEKIRKKEEKRPKATAPGENTKKKQAAARKVSPESITTQPTAKTAKRKKAAPKKKTAAPKKA